MPRDGEPRTGLSPPLLLFTAAICLLIAGLVIGGREAARKAREAEGVAARTAYQRDYYQRALALQAELVEPAPPEADPIPIDLATVGVRQALRLNGRAVLVTYALLDNDEGRGGFVVHSNDGSDDDNDKAVERSVWVPKGMRVEKTGTALATLYVFRHQPDRGSEGTAFPGYTELRAVLDR